MKRKKLSLEGVIKIDLIKNYMKEHGYTQKSFAAACHISIGTLRRVLDNHSDFRTDKLFKIAKVMQIHVKYLVND